MGSPEKIDGEQASGEESEIKINYRQVNSDPGLMNVWPEGSEIRQKARCIKYANKERTVELLNGSL